MRPSVHLSNKLCFAGKAGSFYVYYLNVQLENRRTLVYFLACTLSYKIFTLQDDFDILFRDLPFCRPIRSKRGKLFLRPEKNRKKVGLKPEESHNNDL